MHFGFHGAAWWRTRTAWAACLVLAVTMLSAGAVAAPSQAQSSKTISFRPGDVFFTDTSGVQEFSPTGELRQTIPGTTGAGALCFTPSGNRLVLPGVGLFNRAGHVLPSSWASAPDGRCAIDTDGNVYVRSGLEQIAKYDLSGRLVETFQVAGGLLYLGISPYYLALGPDQCTIYYGAFDARTGRFDVCSDTQESPLFLNSGLIDDLQIRPNDQIVATGDPVAFRFDSTGAFLQSYVVGPAASDLFRSVSLDPDGTSFWDCCNSTNGVTPPEIFRFDIASGQILAAWAPPVSPNGMAVYGPQRLG